MTPRDRLTFLQSDLAQAALAQIHETPINADNHLTLAMALRQQFAPAEAQALLDQALLRQKGATKFSRAGQMFFERTALEQASGEQISQHRAARFSPFAGRWLADLGCSIGGDALSLATVGPVLGLEMDLERLLLARHNVALYAPGRFHPVQTDLRQLAPLPVAAFFFDPARRDAQGRRQRDPARYEPPLSLISTWRGRVPHAGVKLAPGIAYEDVPELAETELEFIALDYELKEAVAWYGGLRSGVTRRATILPAGATLTEADGVAEGGAIRPVGPYLYEPNPAILRAGLVTQLGSQLNAAQIDPQIAYLTADAWQPTPFARAFSVTATFPFQLKRLRQYLRERRIGRVTIKKRGSPLDVARLEQQLRLKGDEEATLFLTQAAGQPIVILGQPLP